MKHKYTKDYLSYCSRAGLTPSPKVSLILSKAEGRISRLVDMLRRAKCPKDSDKGHSLPCEFCIRRTLLLAAVCGIDNKTVAADDDDPVEIVNDTVVISGVGGPAPSVRLGPENEVAASGGGGGGPAQSVRLGPENIVWQDEMSEGSDPENLRHVISIPIIKDGKKIGSISSYCPVGVDMEIKIFPGGKGIGIKTKRENGDSE